MSAQKLGYAVRLAQFTRELQNILSGAVASGSFRRIGRLRERRRDQGFNLRSRALKKAWTAGRTILGSFSRIVRILTANHHLLGIPPLSEHIHFSAGATDLPYAHHPRFEVVSEFTPVQPRHPPNPFLWFSWRFQVIAILSSPVCCSVSTFHLPNRLRRLFGETRTDITSIS